MMVEPLLGTRAEVQVTAQSVVVAAEAERSILREVERLEHIFTVFDDASPLNELRRTGSTSVPELSQVVALAETWRRRSSGTFNPRTQSFIDLWDRADASGALPSSSALEACVVATSTDAQPVDNLNAIAKGWIAQRALNSVDIIDDAIDAAWLSLGGDIVHRGSGSVRVGIEDPHRPYDNVAPMATISISNEAIATSGGSRRWWTIGGTRYPKVINPRTGCPVGRVASATIVAPDAAVADALATIATVAETAETLALVQDAGAVCLLVHDDRSRTCSSARFTFDQPGATPSPPR